MNNLHFAFLVKFCGKTNGKYGGNWKITRYGVY